MQFTDKLMQIEITRFGSFPFDSYGQVLVQQNDVGMESQTMTVLPDWYSHSTSGQIFTTVGHEMAHQWFGDSVALSDWAEIWLNEGFASYAEYIDLQDSGGTAQAAQLLQSWKADLESSGEIEPLVHLKPNDLFGIDAYEKGGYVLHMLREQIGDAAFFKTLQTYAMRYRYHNATSDDFWAVAEEVSGQDLAQFFSQWLDYPDLPSLDITWSESSGQVQTLVCQRSAQPFTLDVPVALSDLSGSGAGQSETLHLSGVETHTQFPVGFDVGTWQIDPNGQTVIGQANVVQADSLPAHCN